MLSWLHEKPFSDFGSPRSEERASFSLGRGNPWGLGRDKDRRLAFGPRGPASRMDNGSLGLNSYESEPLDPCGEPRRSAGFTTEAEAWQAHWLSAQGANNHRRTPGEIAARLWAESSAVGWANFGDPLKAALWDNLKGKAGPEMDASLGVSAEASQLHLSASESRRGPEVPQGFKKNLRRWERGKRWSSRTRRALACILD